MLSYTTCAFKMLGVLSSGWENMSEYYFLTFQKCKSKRERSERKGEERQQSK